METSSNLGKSLLPPPFPPPPLFHNFLDPLLAFSIAILCFFIYHVMYFWSVDLFGSNMLHIHQQGFTPINKRPRLLVVPRFSSGIVERAKRERA